MTIGREWVEEPPVVRPSQATLTRAKLRKLVALSTALAFNIWTFQSMQWIPNNQRPGHSAQHALL
jgi:hypothetical protein